MNRILIVICLFLLNAQFLSAATVSLSGTVKSSAGSPIPGATVTLSKMQRLSATTDAQGVFSLGGTGVSQLPSAGKSRFQCSLSGNNLVISPVFENMDGGIEVFSCHGRKTASISFRGTTAGKQSVNLPGFMSGLNIIRVTIGNESITQSFICLGRSNRYLKNNVPNTGAAGNFTLSRQASAAAVDTLLTSKSGYTDAKVPVNSYQAADIAIVMQETNATGEMPFVYDKEHTGADCAKPPLPAVGGLTSCKYLPDPFEWSDKTRGRITTRADWRCRRAEIMEEIMKYETGQKPPKPEKFEATLSGNTITITVGVGSSTFKMTATISRPSGAPSGPIPAILIPGSLTDVFSSRGIAKITINWGQLTGDAFSGAYDAGSFYKLYPGTDAGYMIRWAWGVSRVIDALEALPEAKIDTKHLAVSGCSYGGKIALYSGAFDERIALTIPHESGGGGTISWRYSDMLEDRDKTEVENLHHAQGASWYSNALRDFTNIPDKLPFDQDELMAMCAPRAIFCIESSKIARMGAEAARLDAVAARKIYAALGIEDRIGVTEANVDHCTWASSYTADLSAFVDKFLLGKDVNTNILRSRFTGVDTTTWIPWVAPVLK